MSKKKIECRMFNVNAELWDFVKIVGKVGTKFKIDSKLELETCNQILALAKEARRQGKNPNSKETLEKIIPILKENLSDYIDFKEWSDAEGNWVSV